MTAMIRAEALQGFSALVSELGGDAQRLLRRVHIDPAVQTREESFFPHRQLVHLLENTAEELACPDFGLRLAQRQDIGILGPIAVAARSCKTLGEALTLTGKFLFVHSPALRFRMKLQKDRSSILLATDLLLERIPNCRQIDELAVGVMHRMIKTLSNQRYRPLEAQFAHTHCASPKVYRKFFDCAVRFDQEVDGLLILVKDLEMPIHEHNPQLKAIATGYLESHFTSPFSATAERVRAAVRRLLRVGAGSQQDVAAALLMHPRTLQRRLRDEQTSFDMIKDEVRKELAQRYLGQSLLPLSHITALLGYSEQSALTRSCQRWFGKPPRTLRAGLVRSL
ncbi:MAG: AraC family transcriptional regulator ligand-binding domain-containing protein [Stenotrophobium sp.]